MYILNVEFIFRGKDVSILFSGNKEVADMLGSELIHLHLNEQDALVMTKEEIDPFYKWCKEESINEVKRRGGRSTVFTFAKKEENE